MKKLIPVEEHKNLFRDPTTNAILNLDEEKRLEHRKKVREMREKNQRMERLEHEVVELKELVKTLINKMESR